MSDCFFNCSVCFKLATISLRLLPLSAVTVVLLAPARAEPKKILLSNGDPALLKELSSVSPDARIVPVTQQTVMREIADADAFIGEPTPEQVRAGKKLKWVQVMAAGVERVLFLSGGNDLRDSEIVLTNNKIVQGPEIADHAMAMLLALSRDLPTFWSSKQRETGQPRPYRGIELNGRTAVSTGLA